MLIQLPPPTNLRHQTISQSNFGVSVVSNKSRINNSRFMDSDESMPREFLIKSLEGFGANNHLSTLQIDIGIINIANE